MNYSDTWLVGYNQPSQVTNENGEMEISLNGTPYAYVYSYGSYQDSYSMYGHQTTVGATLRSPAGRSFSSASSGGAYTRVDASLQFFEDDPGDYAMSHSTMLWCPSVRSMLGGGGASSFRRLGVSYSVYEKVLDQGPNRAVYRQIRPCDIYCGVGGATGNFVFVGGSLPPYFVVGVPFFQLFGGVFCENIITSFSASDVRRECADIGIF